MRLDQEKLDAAHSAYKKSRKAFRLAAQVKLGCMALVGLIVLYLIVALFH